MAFIDQAQDLLAKGASAARGAVSGVAVEQLGFVRGFVRLCSDGWGQGWHERNGGNASYRLTALEAAWVREACSAGPWEPLGAPAPGVGGELFRLLNH